MFNLIDLWKIEKKGWAIIKYLQLQSFSLFSWYIKSFCPRHTIWLFSSHVSSEDYKLLYFKRLEEQQPDNLFALSVTFILFQALLRGALTQQSAVILVCMAVDRYVCMLHPHRYHKHSSKRVSYFIICTHSHIS